MKTLIIYDNIGMVIKSEQGVYKIPNGLPYLEVEIPAGKYVESVDVVTKVPVFADIPKSDTENKVDILEAQVSKMLLEIASMKVGV